VELEGPTTLILDLDREDLVGPTYFLSGGCFQKQKRQTVLSLKEESHTISNLLYELKPKSNDFRLHSEKQSAIVVFKTAQFVCPLYSSDWSDLSDLNRGRDFIPYDSEEDVIFPF